MATPIVLILYNRPHTTARVWEAIRAARPSRLFVIADGARKPEHSALCAAARQITETVDWDCAVTRLYADVNLGIKARVESGLNAVFAEVEQAIILEDDCLPDRTFFPFCEQLLSRYAGDPRVMAISGVNFLFGGYRSAASYYFSRTPLCWGWATWRRAWAHYDPQMSVWQERRDTSWLIDKVRVWSVEHYWRTVFEREALRPENWDYHWIFACWLANGLCAIPGVNLVTNIGFGASASHTRDVTSPFARLTAESLSFPLTHPVRVEADAEADRLTEETTFSHIDLDMMFAAARSVLKRNRDGR